MTCKTLSASIGLFALFLTACPGESSDDTGGSTDQATTDMPTTDNPTTGDSSTGEPAGCPVDLCMTYGAAVPKVSSDITDKAATDPMFMADFAPLVMEGAPAVQAFKDSLTAFISDAYKCSTGMYTGPSMEAAHAGMGITQAEYDAFIGLIVGVLTDNGVPEDHINLCFAPTLTDPAFANTIIGK